VTVPRRHHTVPKSYLRRFANTAEQVTVVSRDDLSRKFTASIDDILAERDFYAFETEDGSSSYEAEELFSTFEHDASQALTRVIAGAFPPTEQDRVHISVFVAAQFLRGWDMREAMAVPFVHVGQMIAMNATKESVRAFFRRTEDREPSDEEVRDYVDFAKDTTGYRIEVHPNELIRQLLQSIPGLANMAFARTWQLLRTEEGHFLTSDAPVSTWTHQKNRHPFYGSGGFGMSDELSLPIDRQHALVLAHDAPAGEVVRDVGLDHVRALNRRTATSGRRYIIHHPDDEPLLGMELPPSGPKMVASEPPQRLIDDDE
jgi:Protein of unknown function (DUF4238)